MKGTTSADTTGVVKYPNTTNKVVTINPYDGSVTAPGGFIGKASSADEVDWSNITNIPQSFTPNTHTHGYI